MDRHRANYVYSNNKVMPSTEEDVGMQPLSYGEIPSFELIAPPKWIRVGLVTGYCVVTSYWLMSVWGVIHVERRSASRATGTGALG